MIAKIKTGKFFKGAFQYNLNKVEEGKASLFYSRMFKTENPTDMLDEFLEMSTLCPNVSSPVFHTSINFSPEEHLDDDILQAVVDEYMERLGYGNTPYVVFKHSDTAHQHVHIISANIENVNGKYKKIKDSHQHRRSEAISRVIERQYGLVIATDTKKKQRELAAFIPELKEYGTIDTYQQLHNVVEFIVSNYKFNNLIELNKLLNKYNIACYKNKNKIGQEFYKFTFQNPQTRKNIGISGTPIQLKLNFSSDELEKLFAINKQHKTKILSILSEISKEMLSTYMFVSQEDFDKLLKKQGIIKIDGDNYLYQAGKAVITRQQLKIPGNFINTATLKKEYFSGIVKSATEYRKSVSIFHESTMFSRPEHIDAFKNFFRQQNTHLTLSQQDLLFNSFCKYKQNNLDKIKKKEHDKDVNQVNKMFNYVSKLNISEKTAKVFLERFNIYIDGGEVVKIGNSMDRVIHEVDKNELIPVCFSGKDYTTEVSDLNDAEMLLIKDACNNKQFHYDQEIRWERVEPFIPQEYAEMYHLEEQFEQEQPIESSEGISFLDVLNSKNEYEYLHPKKKKKKGEEDENPKKNRGRRR